MADYLRLAPRRARTRDVAAVDIADGGKPRGTARREAAAPRGALRVVLSGAFGIREAILGLPGFAAQHPKLGIDLSKSDRTGARTIWSNGVFQRRLSKMPHIQ